MKTMFTRPWGGETLRSLSTAQTCPTISPAVRLRFTPSNAVRQNWQSTAQPTWLETQMVARPQPRSPFAAEVGSEFEFEFEFEFERSLASLPSPASPPSPSGIQTVSTLW